MAFDLTIKDIEIPKHLKNKWLIFKAYVKTDGDGNYLVTDMVLMSEENITLKVPKKGRVTRR